MQAIQCVQNQTFLAGWRDNGVSLFHFNPSCEMSVANGCESYVLPAHIKKFEDDLATLPCFFGRSADYVLVAREVGRCFTDYLLQLSFETPVFITLPAEIQSSVRLDMLRPWGWSPAEHRKLHPFKAMMNTGLPIHPFLQWKNEHALLLSRHTTLRLVQQLNCVDKQMYPLLDIPAPPLQLTTLNEVEAVIETIPPPALLKTPWSASGRGLFRIRNLYEHAESNHWVKSMLRKQGFLLAEPFLKKVQDVSFHFYADADTVQFIGTTFFEADAKGQFIGCYVRQPMQPVIDSNHLSEACQQAVRLLQTGLQQLKITQHYQGPIGIDAIFFENAAGTIKLNPCVEINLRHTMGLLNLFIRQHIHPDRNGIWTVGKSNAVTSDWYVLPAGTMNDGFIASGTIWLTPPFQPNSYAVSIRME